MQYTARHYDSQIIQTPVESYDYNSFTKVQTYINRSRRPIVVTHRNNLPSIISPVQSISQSYGEFVIRTIYKLNGYSDIVSFCEALELYSNRFPSSRDELHLMREHVMEQIKIRSGINKVTITIDKSIRVEDIISYGALYIDLDDILLCTDERIGEYPHPRSVEGEVNYNYGIHDSEDCASGVYVEIIDNDSQHGTRYMYTAKQVIEIEPIRSRSRQDGVYLSKVRTNALGKKEVNTECKSFSEAKEDWGIHTNIDDAITGGDPSVVSRTELEGLNHENAKLRHSVEATKLNHEQIDAASRLQTQSLTKEIELLKLENQRIKEEYDRTKAERTEQIESLKARRTEHYEDRSARRKDYYEDRSYSRKDGTELLKVGAMAFAAGIGIFKLLN